MCFVIIPVLTNLLILVLLTDAFAGLNVTPLLTLSPERDPNPSPNDAFAEAST